MEPLYWIPENAASLLDVGCGVGELLYSCRRNYPRMRLAGIDIRHRAVETARTRLPDAVIRQGYGFELPFGDGQFQCVTCIEVIEHVAERHRALLIAEMRRVLVPGGRLVLRCPHAGLFSWLDAQNLRFRFPKLYRRLLGEGLRDAQYREAKEELVWHHHFTRDELIRLAGNGWEVEACRFGGLCLWPISDILRWPFYRLRRPDHWIARALERIAGMELEINFGRSSYGILVALRKLPIES